MLTLNTFATYFIESHENHMIELWLQPPLICIIIKYCKTACFLEIGYSMIFHDIYWSSQTEISSAHLVYSPSIQTAWDGNDWNVPVLCAAKKRPSPRMPVFMSV